MLKSNENEPAAARVTTLLDEIATALHSQNAALSGPTSCDPAETAELLRLWLTIIDERDRAKVLAFVRNAATRRTQYVDG